MSKFDWRTYVKRSGSGTPIKAIRYNGNHQWFLDKVFSLDMRCLNQVTHTPKCNTIILEPNDAVILNKNDYVVYTGNMIYVVPPYEFETKYKIKLRRKK